MRTIAATFTSTSAACAAKEQIQAILPLAGVWIAAAVVAETADAPIASERTLVAVRADEASAATAILRSSGGKVVADIETAIPKVPRRPALRSPASPT